MKTTCGATSTPVSQTGELRSTPSLGKIDGTTQGGRLASLLTGNGDAPDCAWHFDSRRFSIGERCRFPARGTYEETSSRHSGSGADAVALVVTTSTSCGLRMAGGLTASAQTEQEIRSLENRLREAALAGATAVLNDLLADDYTNTDAYGLIRHKAQVIADVESGDSSFEAIGLDDISVSLYGDAAVLTAKRTVRGRAVRRRDPSGQFRQIRVYAKRDGRWQAVMLQITRIAGS